MADNLIDVLRAHGALAGGNCCTEAADRLDETLDDVASCGVGTHRIDDMRAASARLLAERGAE
jgi:hypothetical protein